MAVGETRVKQETDDGLAHLEDDCDRTDGGESDNAQKDSRNKRKDEGSDRGGDGETGGGWAEAMAKILGNRGSSILVKNKDLDRVKAAEREEQLKTRIQVDKKRTWEMMCRAKPDVVEDRDSERVLQRIATRGVVQLFNAVRKHQNSMDEKVKGAGGSERKKAKILSSVSKKDFISVLRRSEGGGRKTEKVVDPAAEEKPAWSVLRDDYMMEASMKDWDKDSDGGEDSRGRTGIQEEHVPATVSGTVEKRWKL